MLKMSRSELSMLTSMKSMIDSLLSESGIELSTGSGLITGSCSCGGGCEGCKGNCKDGCQGCDWSMKAGYVDNFTFEDIKVALDNLREYGPVVFNKEFLAELLLREETLAKGAGEPGRDVG